MGNKKRVLGLSLVTAILLGSSAYAGKIIGVDATTPYEPTDPLTQFGFGGWNFDNVDVKITDLEYNDIGKTFDISDGTYDEMVLGDSFESEILTDGEIRGHLHGKDWPVGEPAGIKIINNDADVSNGKPVNCIMTSSYLDTGYLDTDAPEPVICSSPWQTHKRFKINLLPTSVDIIDEEGYGEPIDLVFNLDTTDTAARRYQVLQKANNYTGKRLDGYKVEVLKADGTTDPALTLSLGAGENDGADIWRETDNANFSHGLWGPYQRVGGEVRFENGFFDWIRSYFPATLSADKKSISYTGDMLGGNYQAIFGNWLPSIWAPKGIFWDDDMDPATDGILMTFYGVAPGETELAWWTRSVVDVDPEDNIDPVYTWAQATPEELTEWDGEWYEEDHVEDVLNLGLNYIIEVGENAKIGDTFTLRLTPHVAADQTEPIYVNPPVITPNVAPVADAGADQIVQVGTSITITGSGTDPDGEEGDLPLTYVWSENSKNNKETTELATTAQFEYTPTSLGVHTLTLTVTDEDGATGTDTMTVKARKNAPVKNEPQGPKK